MRVDAPDSKLPAHPRYAWLHARRTPLLAVAAACIPRGGAAAHRQTGSLPAPPARIVSGFRCGVTSHLGLVNSTRMTSLNWRITETATVIITRLSSRWSALQASGGWCSDFRWVPVTALVDHYLLLPEDPVQLLPH